MILFFFFSSRRRHTRWPRDWSSDVCSSDLDGSIQGLLKIANLPFIGPDVLGSAICMDKDIAKRLMQGAGINVTRGKAYTNTQRDKINYAELTADLGDRKSVV